MSSKPRSQRSADGPAQSLRVRKSTRRKRLNRRSVLAAMDMMMTDKTPDSPHDPVQDFLTTGRTGRRNAMPDILGEHAATSTGDLPDCLQKLNTSETSPATPNEPEASTSGGAGTGSTRPQNPTASPQDPPKKENPESANS